jgi:nucleoside-diphosphate-sugar epimerase
VALVRPGSDLNGTSKLPNVRVVYGEMEDVSWTKDLPHPFDGLLHLAVNWNRLDPREDQALIDAFASKGMERLIYFSSVCAGGVDLSPQPLCEETEPIFLDRDFYGKYKWAVEKFIRARVAEGAFDATIVRPTMVYGPGDRSNVFPLFEAVRKGCLSLWNHGTNRIRFCYIGNLVAAMVAIVQSECKGVQTYHLGDLECLPLAKMSEEIAASLGMRFRYENHSRITGRILGWVRFVANRLQLANSFATHFNFDKWSRRIEADISRLRTDFPDLQFIPVTSAVKATTSSYLKEGLL